METLNANAMYQKNFRNKKAEEKKRVEELIENYSKLSAKKLLIEIKVNVKKNIFLSEDGQFCIREKNDQTQAIAERIEYLSIVLRTAATLKKAERLKATKKRLREEELEKHRAKMKKISKAKSLPATTFI